MLYMRSIARLRRLRGGGGRRYRPAELLMGFMLHGGWSLAELITGRLYPMLWCGTQSTVARPGTTPRALRYREPPGATLYWYMGWKQKPLGGLACISVNPREAKVTQHHTRSKSTDDGGILSDILINYNLSSPLRIHPLIS